MKEGKLGMIVMASVNGQPPSSEKKIRIIPQTNFRFVMPIMTRCKHYSHVFPTQIPCNEKSEASLDAKSETDIIQGDAVRKTMPKITILYRISLRFEILEHLVYPNARQSYWE